MKRSSPPIDCLSRVLRIHRAGKSSSTAEALAKRRRRKFARSVPVIAAALGGMLMPAAMFLVLFGRRIPLALITFLFAMAIIDDLGTISAIAVFYTETINLIWLGFAGLAGYLWLRLGATAIEPSRR